MIFVIIAVLVVVLIGSSTYFAYQKMVGLDRVRDAVQGNKPCTLKGCTKHV